MSLSDLSPGPSATVPPDRKPSRRHRRRAKAAAVPQARPLDVAAEAARVEVVQPLALDPNTVSPVLASMARAWHGEMEPVERVALLDPVVPRLDGTRASPEVEERRAVMAADWAIRRYLANWLHRAGLVEVGAVFGTMRPLVSMADLAATISGLETAAGLANDAWVAAREKAKAAFPAESWDRLREDVRNTVRFLVLASAEASIRVPIEDAGWAKVAHPLWEAAAACFWAVAWDGVRLGTASGIQRRVAAAVLPLRGDLNRQAVGVLAEMAEFGTVRRPAFYDPAGFPALEDLARLWPAMRADLDELQAPVMDVDRVNKPHAAVVAEVEQRVAAGEAFGWVKGWGGEAGGANPDWTQYGLVLGDRPIPHAKAPRTLKLLAGLRGIKVAAFVRLAPGTLLPVHTHPEVAAEGLLQAHVTLKAPPPTASCLLNVAGELRQHVTGGLLVFDGSLPHWALNAARDERVICYLEFHRAAFQGTRRTAGAPT